MCVCLFVGTHKFFFRVVSVVVFLFTSGNVSERDSVSLNMFLCVWLFVCVSVI